MTIFKGVVAAFMMISGSIALRVSAADAISIAVPVAVSQPIEEAAHILLTERGIQTDIDSEEGSSGCVQALGEGRARLAVTTRLISAEDRSSYPEVNFNEIRFGEQAIGLVVSRDVWEGGVHSLTRAQARAIYERRITTWDEVGGPRVKISFFNFEEGHGKWEIFALWLYGDLKKASSGRFQVVKDDQEVKNCVASGTGAMSQISLPLADGKTLFALSIKQDDGKVVEATSKNVANGAYPLAHPLLMIVDDKPTMGAKTFVDFAISPRGQECLKEFGFLSLKDVEPSKP